VRKGRPVQVEITPEAEKTTGLGMIGVRLDVRVENDKIITAHPSPWSQIAKSLLLMVDTLNALIHTKTTGVGVGDLSGPVGIGQVLFIAIRTDFRLALSFLVLLNINLAVVNLLPIPVLDGGHIVFSLIEAIRRRPLNQKFMEATQTVFVALLLTFMAYVTFNDFARIARFNQIRAVSAAPEPAPDRKAP
jgi:regulator of sigma E protease